MGPRGWAEWGRVCARKPEGWSGGSGRGGLEGGGRAACLTFIVPQPLARASLVSSVDAASFSAAWSVVERAGGRLLEVVVEVE
jgi:hypothetical protein